MSEEVASGIIYYAWMNGFHHDVLEYGIKMEVQHTTAEQQLFRLDSTVTRLLVSFLKRIGKDWITNLLSPLIDLVSKSDDCEVDPVKLEADERLQERLERNQQVLRTLTTQFLEAILTHALHTCPRDVLLICQVIHRETMSKFPEAAQKAVGGIVFLRYICPSIIQPPFMKDVEVTPLIRRQLMLVVKIIQNIANDVTFGKKEAFMEPFNGMIQDYKYMYQSFLRSLSIETQSQALKPVKQSFKLDIKEHRQNLDIIITHWKSVFDPVLTDYYQMTESQPACANFYPTVLSPTPLSPSPSPPVSPTLSRAACRCSSPSKPSTSFTSSAGSVPLRSAQFSPLLTRKTSPGFVTRDMTDSFVSTDLQMSPTTTDGATGGRPTDGLPTDGQVTTDELPLEKYSVMPLDGPPTGGQSMTDGQTLTDGLPTDGQPPTDVQPQMDGQLPIDGRSPTDGNPAVDGSLPSGGPMMDTPSVDGRPTDGLSSDGLPTDTPLETLTIDLPTRGGASVSADGLATEQSLVDADLAKGPKDKLLTDDLPNDGTATAGPTTDEPFSDGPATEESITVIEAPGTDGLMVDMLSPRTNTSPTQVLGRSLPSSLRSGQRMARKTSPSQQSNLEVAATVNLTSLQMVDTLTIPQAEAGSSLTVPISSPNNARSPRRGKLIPDSLPVPLVLRDTNSFRDGRISRRITKNSTVVGVLNTLDIELVRRTIDQLVELDRKKKLSKKDMRR
eukprot:TRINITY_DN8790_c0_g2_i4.p1 TRINITY_DN8790_c0_g2~~TRINITY_DN8790_c0_g2_i4.p1  ORF type:complete len:728 (-),score=149.19 TRINITY_DN8790_c0_g2_i4:71-2254(-)